MKPNELIDAGDTDGLLGLVDRLCNDEKWLDLLDLHNLCDEAVARGKQLWAITVHIDYRLALEAPAAIAARRVRPGAGRFALGPLTEVVASTHSWVELAPHLDDPNIAALVAQERVMRGEEILAPSPTLVESAELPLWLQTWEPEYALAEYKADQADFPPPMVTHGPLEPIRADSSNGPPLVESAVISNALRDLTRTWDSESNGRTEVVLVQGSALGAISALGPSMSRAVRIDSTDAIATIAWAAGSGGAHGRRRGAATGRFAAWWALASIGDLDWPPDANEIGEAVSGIDWWLWDAGSPPLGWSLQLAFEQPESGLAGAIDSADAA